MNKLALLSQFLHSANPTPMLRAIKWQTYSSGAKATEGNNLDQDLPRFIVSEIGIKPLQVVQMRFHAGKSSYNHLFCITDSHKPCRGKCATNRR